jgi:hypothetical protein
MGKSYKITYKCDICNAQTVVHTNDTGLDEILCFCNKKMEMFERLIINNPESKIYTESSMI